jgi:ATP-binding cassette subfamily C protein
MGKVGLTEKNDHQEELQLERIDEYTDNEKKKISIARALVNNSSILILDETAGSEKNTSDYEIEELILNMREMTVLSVSHRITKSLMDKYDKVFVIDKGIVVEEGTFSELLLNNDYFYNLYVSNEA